jgi:alginate O-acetyltransferase complex protein AlgI
VVDVYKGNARAERNLPRFALYILLFPQLIAGPIIRWRDIAAQLSQREARLADFAYGVRRFVLGLGKKVLIANTLGAVADRIFALPTAELTTPLAWLGLVCYTLQIYFDFSGYSDMAIGLAHMFGFRFKENFNYPYVSQSIQEFWRRWHISLSAWFRDYLYVPLGGNRVATRRVYLNLVTVFFLCGLWHGASWTFVVWGLYHGVFLVIERLGWSTVLARLPRPARHVYALLVAIVGWVFFRADTLSGAAGMLRAMAGFSPALPTAYGVGWYLTPEVALAMAAGVAGSAPVWPVIAARLAQPSADGARFGPLTSALTFAVLAAVFGGCAMLIAAHTYNPFIYFRF